MKKPKLAVTDKDNIIAELAGKTGHKTLGVWACDCAERALPYFENKYPQDNRPRLAIEAGRAWVKTGVFRMADIRKIAAIFRISAILNTPVFTHARPASIASLGRLSYEYLSSKYGSARSAQSHAQTVSVLWSVLPTSSAIILSLY